MPQLSLHTPLGDLTLTEEDGALVALDWGWGRDQQETPLLREARAQLQDYCDGVRTDFDLPLRPAGGTPYLHKAWDAMQRIPYGATRTYKALAEDIGGSARSVGMACGRNPLTILIPCHRILGANGLGGYSAGEGADTKRMLLDLEARHTSASPSERTT